LHDLTALCLHRARSSGQDSLNGHSPMRGINKVARPGIFRPYRTKLVRDGLDHPHQLVSSLGATLAHSSNDRLPLLHERPVKVFVERFAAFAEVVLLQRDGLALLVRPAPYAGFFPRASFRPGPYDSVRLVQGRAARHPRGPWERARVDGHVRGVSGAQRKCLKRGGEGAEVQVGVVVLGSEPEPPTRSGSPTQSWIDDSPMKPG